MARAGKEVNYSNAGYVIGGLMAEHISGIGWEDVVREHVLERVGMTSTGFGWPATEERPDQPRGHYYEESVFRPQNIGEYPRGDFLAPAGDIHASIGYLYMVT